MRFIGEKQLKGCGVPKRLHCLEGESTLQDLAEGWGLEMRFRGKGLGRIP
jgi:hypothetical protein